MNQGKLANLVKAPADLTLCGRPLENFLQALEDFHGWRAPGAVIGGFMVDWAQAALPPGIEADAVVETCHCLPDAVQLLTPCTFGNGWLKVLDWDKFALSLYDKKTLEGFRVWLDLTKARAFPAIYAWYMRLAPKKSLPLEVLLDGIIRAGRGILSGAPVKITALQGKKEKGATAMCADCGEAYPLRQGDRCLACQGQGYWQGPGSRGQGLSWLESPAIHEKEPRNVWTQAES
jgi:formylmethanofuran dehydrogenase subunit E